MSMTAERLNRVMGSFKETDDYKSKARDYDLGTERMGYAKAHRLSDQEIAMNDAYTQLAWNGTGHGSWDKLPKEEYTALAIAYINHANIFELDNITGMRKEDADMSQVMPVLRKRYELLSKSAQDEVKNEGKREGLAKTYGQLSEAEKGIAEAKSAMRGLVEIGALPPVSKEQAEATFSSALQGNFPSHGYAFLRIRRENHPIAELWSSDMRELGRDARRGDKERRNFHKLPIKRKSRLACLFSKKAREYNDKVDDLEASLCSGLAPVFKNRGLLQKYSGKIMDDETKVKLKEEKRSISDGYEALGGSYIERHTSDHADKNAGGKDYYRFKKRLKNVLDFIDSDGKDPLQARMEKLRAVTKGENEQEDAKERTKAAKEAMKAANPERSAEIARKVRERKVKTM